MKIETYPGTPYNQSELELDDEEWSLLRSYIGSINEALGSEVTTIGGVEEVEEIPPQITKDGFDPGGWVGLYPGDITVVPSHLSENEYQLLLDETQEWVEIIGATTIATTLPLSTDILIDARARLAAYSKALIELTESVQAQRLPVEVRRTRHSGFAPEGRPLFEQTIREASRGSQQVVSEQTQFSFDTLLNHLLVRFHIELLRKMENLAEQYDYYRTAFSKQIGYHEDFVNTSLPSQFVDKAIQTDFSSPSVIEKARREATDEMSEIVDLWEAFRRDIGMELTISNQLNSAVKPISKLYELWCLRILLEILTDISGNSPEVRDSIRRGYRFGEDMKLHYNRSLRGHSKYLRDNLGVGPGEPDFAVEVDNEVIWIGDAKFKTDVKLDDYRRFITYIVDLLSPNHQSAILYVSDDPIGEKSVRDYSIEHFSLRPDTRETVKNKIDSMLRDTLKNN